MIYFALIFSELCHPSISADPEKVKKLVKIERDAYAALENAHALVVCTEWDEFKVRSFPFLSMFSIVINVFRSFNIFLVKKLS
jgi:UDP-glucose 6-dehydrogenase